MPHLTLISCCEIVNARRRLSYQLFWILLFCTVTFAQPKPRHASLIDSYTNSTLHKVSSGFSRTDDSVLTSLGRWAWGPCYAVAACGNYAFIGNGALFQTLDISGSSSPKIVGEYLVNGAVCDIRLRDSLAFVCTGGYLIVLNISDPRSPRKIGELYFPYSATRVRLQDSLAFVRSPGGMLIAVDISTVSSPRMRGSIFAGGYDWPSTLFINKGRYVYVGGDSPLPPAVDIIDATNPDSLKRVGYFLTRGIAGGGAVKDSLLIIGNEGLFEPSSLKIYNISDPASPILIGQLVGTTADGIVLRNSIAFITDTGSVRSVDLSDPRNPIVVGSIQLGAFQIADAGKRLIVAKTPRLNVIATSGNDSLTLVSRFITGSYAHKIALSDTLSLIACEDAGLWIVDVSDLSNPRSISNIYFGEVYARDLLVSEHFAYVLCGAAAADNRGLWIVDFSDASKPKVVSHYVGIVRGSNYSVFNSIAMSGNLVFISQAPSPLDSSVVDIVDVSDVYSPKHVSMVYGAFAPYQVAVRDSLLYVAAGDSGLKILDFHNLQSIREISTLKKFAAYITFRDQWAFAAGDSLYVIEVTDPRNPRILASAVYAYGIGYPSVALSGNFAYTTADYFGLAVIDLRDPLRLRRIATLPEIGYGYGVAAQRDVIFYADGDAGMRILRNQLAMGVSRIENDGALQDFYLSNNYPNPFNNETIIEFNLPARERIKLEIFGVLGEKIATLVNEILDKGNHKSKFDSRNLSSGIYFYRLSGEKKSITRKMIYLK